MKAIFLVFFCYIMHTANVSAQTAVGNDKGSRLDSIRKIHFNDTSKRIAIEEKLQQQALKTNDEELIAFVEILAFTRQIKSKPLILETASRVCERGNLLAGSKH